MVKPIKSFTPPIKDIKGDIVQGSIASLEKIKINGLDHWVLIRGKSTNNPILIYLHGGPGCSEMGLVRYFNQELEEKFLVINFDQRGTCKSYNLGKFPDGSLTTNQIMDDTYKLIKVLLKRFNQKKVFLAGHSWGTIVGTILAKKYLKLIHAYIGIAQVVHMEKAQYIADEFIIKMANKTKNKEAIGELEKVKWIIPHFDEEYLNRVNVEKKWIHYFGGSMHGEKDLDKLMRVIIASPEYNLADVANYIMGSRYSTKKLWREMTEIDFIKQIPALEVPVFFIQGKYDYQTPLILVRKYFKKLKAPKKELIIFNKSAHSPNYEEPEKFNKLIISILDKAIKTK